MTSIAKTKTADTVSALEDKHCTLSDLLGWDKSYDIEIIDGKPSAIFPPSSTDIKIRSELCRQITNFLIGKPWEICTYPLGVRPLEKENEQPQNTDTVLKPDIAVVSDRNKLDEYGCKGAPDLVIEIFPSSRWIIKHKSYNLYQRAGVREYWVVDPQSKLVLVFVSDEYGFFKIIKRYTQNDQAKITTLNDCPINLAAVFSQTE